MFKKSSSRSKFRPEYPAHYVFDYKDVLTLSRFLAEGGKIVPSRISKLSAYQQRAVTKQIKKARHVALIANGMKAYDVYSRPENISPVPFDYE